MSDIKLAFINMESFENGETIRGGILLSDSNTKPLEFRCTSPIRPTALQKVLYGGMLERHILLELVGAPLMKSIKSDPSVVVVRKQALFDLRDKISCPIIWVGKHGESEIKESANPDESPLISSSTGKFEPLIVLGPMGREKETQEARKLLTDVFAQNDLLEPFERIRTALDFVQKQKVGDGK